METTQGLLLYMVSDLSPPLCLIGFNSLSHTVQLEIHLAMA